MSAGAGAMDQPAWLDAWVEESRVAGRPSVISAARAAMHSAAAAPARRRLLPAWALAPRRHPWRAAGVGLAAAAGVALAMGWNAPAGSPFHQVRLGREDVALALARGSSGVDLRLQYADDRLHEARAGSHPEASLREAGSLLDEARADLPADGSDPLWTRWAVEVADLRGQQALLASLPPPAPAAAATPGAEDRQVSASQSTGRPGEASPTSGEATESQGGSRSTSRTDGEGSGPGRGQPPSTGTDGDADAGGRGPAPSAPSSASTRSSTSTSETSDGGGGRPPGDGSGSSSSSRSTSSDDHRASTTSTR